MGVSQSVFIDEEIKESSIVLLYKHRAESYSNKILSANKE